MDREDSVQVLRGDESNQLDPVGGYTVLNLRTEYRFNEHISVFARVENVLGAKYETFGVLGEPEEVLGPGAPVGAWLGVKLEL